MGQEPSSPARNPCFAALGKIEPKGDKPMSLSEMRAAVNRARNQGKKGSGKLTAEDYFKVAEMMKRLGDYGAPEFYDKAIAADSTEPCYEVFYGDYERNFRGAAGPQFPAAERHYAEGRRKLQARRKPQAQPQGLTTPRQGPDYDTEKFLDRGTSALYEQDGVTLFSRSLDDKAQNIKVPSVFLGSINRYAQATSDLDADSDIRDYTSGMLFAQSVRLHSPLTAQQLQSMLRTEKAAETFDRLRFRYKAMPAIDFYYTHRQTSDAQITTLFLPGNFNDFRLNAYGVAAQKPFVIAQQFDASILAKFEVDQRWGLIEFVPGAKERIANYQLQAAISRFLGPDKATLQFVAARQHIHPEIEPIQPNRYRRFVGGNATYSIFRRVPFLQPAYDKRYETRGWDVFAGVLADNESFPPAIVKRRDYFLGTALKGVGRFDFTVQPTWFTSRVDGDRSQRNAQYRTNFITLFRILDEEKRIPEPDTSFYLAFLHLVIPFRHDTAYIGPTAFENFKAGIEVDSKWITYSRWTTSLVSIRFDRQKFTQLDKSKNSFTAQVSLGF
jgi:hypothetical protein